ncbi:type II CAAX endopeptidase family protein [Actinomycetospora chlora]|uniref:Type II CAAX endopeptidase family protein n=1 Tax=Actinomycetospora chlora TaxID=663608 RepID=A0ABP9CKE1_9PSEU
MAIAPDQPTSVPARRGLVARHPLTAFFVLAYALSWIVWAPWVLGTTGAGWLPTTVEPPATGYLNATAILLGPTGAALIVTALTDGRAGLRLLGARLVRWRVSVWWYLLALVGVPLLAVLGCTVVGGVLPDLAALGGPGFLLSYAVSFVLVAVVGGPLFEEIGWRGFALPRLQQRLHPAAAALVLGLLWALWHLPQFFDPSWTAASGGGGPVGIALFVATAVTFSFVTSWFFNGARYSVLIAVLVHTSIDAATTVTPAIFPPALATSAVPLLVSFGAAAVVLLVVTRGRLGLPRDREIS